jgi:hypothetical protein
MQDAWVVDAAVAVLCTCAGRLSTGVSALHAKRTNSAWIWPCAHRNAVATSWLLALANLRDAPANKEGPAEKS